MFKETSFTTKNPRRAIHWSHQDNLMDNNFSISSRRMQLELQVRKNYQASFVETIQCTTPQLQLATPRQSRVLKGEVNVRLRQLAQPTGQDPANRVFRLCIPKLAGTAQSLKSRSWRRQPFVKVEQDPLPLREARSSPL